MKMNNKLLLGLLAATSILLASCKDNVSLPDQPLEDYIQLYMPQAANGPVTFNFSTGDQEADTIIYGAGYGGYGYPDQDVTLNFGIDPSVVEGFNQSNGTDYALLPEGSYELSDKQTVIKKGELSTAPMKVTVYTTGEKAPLDISKTYLLPISLQKASVKINPALQTFYCLINIVPSFFDRSNWKVVDFSSEEAVGEGPDNGRAVFALDGDINTFWHSQWKDASPVPPHYFTIDMGTSKRILGSVLTDRQNVGSGRPEEVEILVSENGADWTKAYEGTLADTGDQQKIFFAKPVEGRYVKFLVNTVYGSAFTNLAEFNLF